MQNTRLCLHNVLAASGCGACVCVCPVAILFLFLATPCAFFVFFSVSQHENYRFYVLRLVQSVWQCVKSSLYNQVFLSSFLFLFSPKYPSLSPSLSIFLSSPYGRTNCRLAGRMCGSLCMCVCILLLAVYLLLTVLNVLLCPDVSCPRVLSCAVSALCICHEN